MAIYLGIRGPQFETFIKSVLETRGRLKPKYIDYLLSEKGMKIYDQVFTHSTAGPNNYELFEQLGDATANKCIVWYFVRRFPQLNRPDAVTIIALLKIKYSSKQVFYKLAENLGFWDYISASEDERGQKKKSLLEDTLEAFIGATEYIIDSEIREGVGYSICYDIIKSLFDEVDISLAYENLKDPKTRLKELFDMNRSKLGYLVYVHIGSQQTPEGYNLQIIGVFGTITQMSPNAVLGFYQEGKIYPIGVGTASLKMDAEQKAALAGLEYLKKAGYEERIPEVFKLIK